MPKSTASPNSAAIPNPGKNSGDPQEQTGGEHSENLSCKMNDNIILCKNQDTRPAQLQELLPRTSSTSTPEDAKTQRKGSENSISDNQETVLPTTPSQESTSPNLSATNDPEGDNIQQILLLSERKSPEEKIESDNNAGEDDHADVGRDRPRNSFFDEGEQNGDEPNYSQLNDSEENYNGKNPNPLDEQKQVQDRQTGKEFLVSAEEKLELGNSDFVSPQQMNHGGELLQPPSSSSSSPASRSQPQEHEAPVMHPLPSDLMTFSSCAAKMLRFERATGARALRGLLDREGETNLCLIDVEASCVTNSSCTTTQGAVTRRGTMEGANSIAVNYNNVKNHENHPGAVLALDHHQAQPNCFLHIPENVIAEGHHDAEDSRSVRSFLTAGGTAMQIPGNVTHTASMHTGSLPSVRFLTNTTTTPMQQYRQTTGASSTVVPFFPSEGGDLLPGGEQTGQAGAPNESPRSARTSRTEVSEDVGLTPGGRHVRQFTFDACGNWVEQVVPVGEDGEVAEVDYVEKKEAVEDVAAAWAGHRDEGLSSSSQGFFFNNQPSNFSYANRPVGDGGLGFLSSTSSGVANNNQSNHIGATITTTGQAGVVPATNNFRTTNKAALQTGAVLGGSTTITSLEQQQSSAEPVYTSSGCDVTRTQINVSSRADVVYGKNAPVYGGAATNNSNNCNSTAVNYDSAETPPAHYDSMSINVDSREQVQQHHLQEMPPAPVVPVLAHELDRGRSSVLLVEDDNRNTKTRTTSSRMASFSKAAPAFFDHQPPSSSCSSVGVGAVPPPGQEHQKSSTNSKPNEDVDVENYASNSQYNYHDDEEEDHRRQSCESDSSYCQVQHVVHVQEPPLARTRTIPSLKFDESVLRSLHLGGGTNTAATTSTMGRRTSSSHQLRDEVENYSSSGTTFFRDAIRRTRSREFGAVVQQPGVVAAAPRVQIMNQQSCTSNLSSSNLQVNSSTSGTAILNPTSLERKFSSHLFYNSNSYPSNAAPGGNQLLTSNSHQTVLSMTTPGLLPIPAYSPAPSALNSLGPQSAGAESFSSETPTAGTNIISNANYYTGTNRENKIGNNLNNSNSGHSHNQYGLQYPAAGTTAALAAHQPMNSSTLPRISQFTSPDDLTPARPGRVSAFPEMINSQVQMYPSRPCSGYYPSVTHNLLTTSNGADQHYMARLQPLQPGFSGLTEQQVATPTNASSSCTRPNSSSATPNNAALFSSQQYSQLHKMLQLQQQHHGCATSSTTRGRNKSSATLYSNNGAATPNNRIQQQSNANSKPLSPYSYPATVVAQDFFELEQSTGKWQLPDTVRKMLDAFNNDDLLRVKKRANRIAASGGKTGDSFPLSSVFDCRKLHEKLSDKEWENAEKEIAESLRCSLTRGVKNKQEAAFVGSSSCQQKTCSAASGGRNNPCSSTSASSTSPAVVGGSLEQGAGNNYVETQKNSEGTKVVPPLRTAIATTLHEGAEARSTWADEKKEAPGVEEVVQLPAPASASSRPPPRKFSTDKQLRKMKTFSFSAAPGGNSNGFFTQEPLGEEDDEKKEDHDDTDSKNGSGGAPASTPAGLVAKSRLLDVVEEAEQSQEEIVQADEDEGGSGTSRPTATVLQEDGPKVVQEAAPEKMHDDEETSEQEEEPSISLDLAQTLSKGLCDLAKYLAEQWLLVPECAKEMLRPERDENRLVWMAQCIVRSPDDEKCSDGPPWHIDEHFYYLHGVISFLSCTTELVDIRDEVRECQGGAVLAEEKFADHVVPPEHQHPDNEVCADGEKEGEEQINLPPSASPRPSAGDGRLLEGMEFISGVPAPGTTGGAAVPAAAAFVEEEHLQGTATNDSTTVPMKNETREDVVVEPATLDPRYDRWAPIRKFAVKEHTIGRPRELTEKRFSKYPKLQQTEAKRVIAPRPGRDFAMYFGGEHERPGSLCRAAIHQGPWKTEEFLRKGRVSFFFAVFDWASNPKSP
ncbi:unnamed protein product [Amoebophrya sp. A120]|nr:unnamed protein product [Amoebophrya sp. A120]|eukprot:GSA120T00001076001.1